MTANIFFNGNRIIHLLSLYPPSWSEYDLLELSDLTYSIPLFSRFRAKYSDLLQKKCLRSLTLECFTKNQFIYEKNDPGSKYFILLKGEVSLCEAQIISENSDSSSDRSSDIIEDETILPQVGRMRSKVITICPEFIYEFSEKLQKNLADIKQAEVISDDVIENECKDLLEFIIQANSLEEIDKEVKTLRPGEDFGQEALHPTRKRNLNAIAKTDVMLASLTRTKFRKIIKVISRERTLQMFAFLQSVSVFSKWSRYELGRILGMFKQKVFTKGQFMFKQGEVPTHAYIISKGSFSINKTVSQPNPGELLRPQLRNFTSRKNRRAVKIDLVLKGEKEFVGTEEIIENLPKRIFSCVCSSAVAEVYEITQYNFLQKLVRPEHFEKFSGPLRTDSNWIKHRSMKLENREIEFSGAMETLSFDRAQTGGREKRDVRWGKTLDLRVVKRHVKVASEGGKDYEKQWKVVEGPKIVWDRCETGNIHMVKMKRKNPRLAPPNFLYRVRMKLEKKSEGKGEESLSL